MRTKTDLVFASPSHEICYDFGFKDGGKELAVLRQQLDECRDKTIDECVDIVIKNSPRITEMGTIIETLRALKHTAPSAPDREVDEAEAE